MPTIHMEVEPNRSLVNNIRNTSATIQGSFSSLSNQVHSTVGSSWVAPSATEFLESFQEVSLIVREALNKMEVLSAKLQNEILEWEQTAAKLD